MYRFLSGSVLARRQEPSVLPTFRTFQYPDGEEETLDEVTLALFPDPKDPTDKELLTLQIDESATISSDSLGTLEEYNLSPRHDGTSISDTSNAEIDFLEDTSTSSSSSTLQLLHQLVLL